MLFVHEQNFGRISAGPISKHGEYPLCLQLLMNIVIVQINLRGSIIF